MYPLLDPNPTPKNLCLSPVNHVGHLKLPFDVTSEPKGAKIWLVYRKYDHSETANHFRFCTALTNLEYIINKELIFWTAISTQVQFLHRSVHLKQGLEVKYVAARRNKRWFNCFRPTPLSASEFDQHLQMLPSSLDLINQGCRFLKPAKSHYRFFQQPQLTLCPNSAAKVWINCRNPLKLDNLMQYMKEGHIPRAKVW